MATFIVTEDEKKNGKINWYALIVIFGGFLVHLTLGTIYTFGNFSPYIMSYLRNRTDDSEIRNVDGIWIQATMVIGQGAAIAIGGVLDHRFGPRIATIIGCWSLSAGTMLTYFTVQKSFALTVVTYGVVFGLGLGTAYGVPMGVAMKWMPHRRGLVSGLVLFGFGGGAFIFNQIITGFINPDNYSPDLEVNGARYFTQEDMLDRVPYCFLIIGGTYAVVQLIGVLLIRDPPSEEFSKDIIISKFDENTVETSSVSKDGDIVSKPIEETNIARQRDLTPLQVLKSRDFYVIWFMFLFGGQGITLLSSLYKAYGQTFIHDDLFLALVGSCSAIFNASGRPLWGALMDKFSFKTAMQCLYAGFICLVITIHAAEWVGKSLYFVWICLIFLIFSGNFALFPAATSKLFGPKYVNINYGMVFSAAIVCNIIGAFLGTQLKEQIGWHGMFFFCGGSVFIAFLMALCYFPKGLDGQPV
ncbi:hypothetical protein ScPMuIL_017387 [Solemya velum]